MKVEKKIVIVLNDYKLPVFKRRLKRANFEYEYLLGPTPGAVMLAIEHVENERLNELRQLVIAAENECKGIH